ncbi:MAG: NADH-quinone oxidoreductase subunit NuoH [Acidobacteriota bacterium]
MSSHIIDWLIIPFVKILAIFGFIVISVLLLVWLERRVVGFIQSRLGPNRVGPFGLLQTVADTIKLLLKEDIVPHKADRRLFNLGPIVVFVPLAVAFALIPFGGNIKIFGKEVSLYLADLNIGLLFVIAFSSLGIFGIILGGWAANSKYPLLGSLRSAAQMVSYEVALGLSIISVLFFSKSLSLVDIVEAQKQMGVWFIFIQPVAFFIFLIAGIAETNRCPFDLPEAESELVGGFHTEYSGIKFAFYFLAEYAHMVLISALVVILFLGGWYRPFPNVEFLSFLDVVPDSVWFILKFGFFIYLYIWIRGTFPRYRYDQLLELSWKGLIPLALANIIVTGFILILIR